MKKLMIFITTIAVLFGMLPTDMIFAYDIDVEVTIEDEDSNLTNSVGIKEDKVSSSEFDQTVLSILHTNDVHGRFDAGIHFARLATIAKEYRAQSPNTLLLDAGDAIHGTNFANMFRGESMIDLMNLVGFDAMVAGNHEFNYGQARLLELAAKADFPILAANVFNADEIHYLSPYTIIPLEDVTVGIFGLATPTTPTVTNPNNVLGLSFTDPVYMAQQMVDHLKPQVDVVIALTHLGLSGVRGSQEVAAAVDGIDLIVEGHCHSVRPNGVIVNDTTIVTVGAHAANLGTVEITLENGEVVSIVAGMYTTEDVADVTHDPDVLALISHYMDQLNVVLTEHVGYSESFLSNDYVRRAETALGNLTGDLFLEVTGADIAMMNSGGIRDHLHAGEITIGDVFNIFPFGNVIEVYEISGQTLLDALENSVSMFEINNPIHAHGRFPQVAGMRFTFDISQPTGSRISNLLIGGEPVDLATSYTLATSGFVGAGGDGFTMIPEHGTFIGEFGSIDENLISFIRARGRINPQIEGRMLMRDEFGYVRNPGVNEAYITANNFVIHIDDVDTMDVMDLSDATFTLNGDVIDGAYLSYTVGVEGVGIYPIAFTASYGNELFKDIGDATIFVVDDCTAWSHDYVIFSHNELTKPFTERGNITAELLKDAGNFEAFRVEDGMNVTESLVVNTTDLKNVQMANAPGIFNIRVYLNPEAVIAVVLADDRTVDEDDDHIVDDKDNTHSGGTNNGNENGGGQRLPQTGVAIVKNISWAGLVFLSLGVVMTKAKKSN